jgi:hypothetical protein
MGGRGVLLSSERGSRESLLSHDRASADRKVWALDPTFPLDESAIFNFFTSGLVALYCQNYEKFQVSFSTFSRQHPSWALWSR